MHFHATQVHKPIPSYHIYKGTLFELVDQAIDFVMSKIDLWVGTRKDGPQVPVAYEIPREVVSEAIVNAVAHRDYTSTGSVQVMLFSDRLEVWSPGELRPPMTLAKLTRPHPSLPVNPLIAEPLYLTKYIEKAGSGTLDMIELCRAAGLRAPEFRLDVGCFIVTIHRKERAVTGQVTEPVTGHVGTKSALSRHQVKSKSGPKSKAQVEAQVVLTELEQRILLSSREENRSGQELLTAAGYETRTGNFKRSLEKLLQATLLEMTIPAKPNSRLQKYRLTAKGRSWLDSHLKGAN